VSKRPIEFFFFDIIVALLKIEHVSNEFEHADQLKHDFKSWDSIIREFEIVGEATKRLINADLLDHDKRSIVNFRNHLVHEYFGIDEEEVWHIIHRHLPLFKEEIRKLIIGTDDLLRHQLTDAFMQENRHLEFVTTYLNIINKENT